MMNNSDIDLSPLLEEYISRGFGLMPKREIDVLLFSALYKQGYFGDNLSEYEISRTLKISDNKVRSLVYEMDLRDQRKSDDELAWLREQLSSPRTTTQVDPSKGTVKIRIESRAAKQALEHHIVTHLKGLTDSSFNPRLLVFDFALFSRLLESLLTQEQAKQLEDGIKKLKQVTPPPRADLKSLFYTFLNSASKEAGKRVFDLPSLIFGSGTAETVTSVTKAFSGLFGLFKDGSDGGEPIDI